MDSMKVATRFFIIAIIILLSGCAARRAFGPPPNPYNTVYSVAVLPMYNLTNDVAGAEMVRKELWRMLPGRHYSVMPLDEVDRTLRERMGITLGAQLEFVQPEEVGKRLGVDGLVYGYLLNFDDITTGVYNVKQVRAAFKLVEASTGRVIWSRALGARSFFVAGKVGAAVTALKELGSADEGIFEKVKGLKDIPGIRSWRIIRVVPVKRLSQAAVLSLGENILTRALGAHLKLEADYVLERLLLTMPSGPGSQPVRKKLLPAVGFLLPRGPWQTAADFRYGGSG